MYLSISDSNGNNINIINSSNIEEKKIKKEKYTLILFNLEKFHDNFTFPLCNNSIEKKN